jgi:aminoglycoside 6-adenylyltransferase
MLEKTYADSRYESTWDALFTMCTLFREVALPLAQQFGLAYPHHDDQRVSAHLQHVRRLPKDAKEMY